MREYKIKQAHKNGEGYKTMVVVDNSDDSKIAEYRLTTGFERQEIASMRRAINKHLDNGGTLGNYQW